MQWTASAAFGLEGQTARDLKRLGIENAPQDILHIGSRHCHPHGLFAGLCLTDDTAEFTRILVHLSSPLSHHLKSIPP